MKHKVESLNAELKEKIIRKQRKGKKIGRVIQEVWYIHNKRAKEKEKAKWGTQNDLKSFLGTERR